MYTVAQVSGIFLGIIGAFFTTKVLSLSTEKNKLNRQSHQFDSEITKKDEIITFYQRIVDNISITWAGREVDRFTSDLLREPGIREYAEEEIFENFYSYKHEYRDEPNQYEVAILEDRYNAILDDIREKIKNRSTGFFGLDYSGILPISLPDLTEQYNEAVEKLRRETDEKDSLVSQKQRTDEAMEDIAIPDSAVRGIGCLFLASLIGIFVPLTYSYWSDIVPQNFRLGLGIIAFLISLIITIIYVGHDLQKEITKSHE